MEHIETLVVGAGQAGLALSQLLSAAGHEHLVLERGNVAQRWRTERWDSFRLLTPNWQTRLPGYRYQGPDAEGFMGRDAVVRFFEEYASSFRAPVRSGVTVRRVTPTGNRWRVWSSAGVYDARNVVVATGHYAVPRRPRVAADLPAGVTQVFARDYRNPAALGDGAVLVVGAGPSGQQIADELACAGRRVFLAVGGHRPLPRSYRGKDVFWWLEQTGALGRTIDTLDEPQAAAAAPGAVLAGERDDLHLRRLVGQGVAPLGHLVGVDGTRLRFADDLHSSLAAADEHTAWFRANIDAYVDRGRLAVPVEAAARTDLPPWATSARTAVDLLRERLTSVVWAAGYQRDYSWIQAPVFSATGEPVQRRGLTRAPGLAFLGLRFMYRRNSNFIDGVGADAAYLADRIISSDAFEPAVA